MLPDNYARPPPLKKRQPAGKRGRRPGGGGKGKLRSKAATKTRLDVEDIMKVLDMATLHCFQILLLGSCQHG